MSTCTTAMRRPATSVRQNVAWATVAAINASRASINTALTLIWHLKKIESKSNAETQWKVSRAGPSRRGGQLADDEQS